MCEVGNALDLKQNNYPRLIADKYHVGQVRHNLEKGGDDIWTCWVEELWSLAECGDDIGEPMQSVIQAPMAAIWLGDGWWQLPKLSHWFANRGMGLDFCLVLTRNSFHFFSSKFLLKTFWDCSSRLETRIKELNMYSGWYVGQHVCTMKVMIGIFAHGTTLKHWGLVMEHAC